MRSIPECSSQSYEQVDIIYIVSQVWAQSFLVTKHVAPEDHRLRQLRLYCSHWDVIGSLIPRDAEVTLDYMPSVHQSCLLDKGTRAAKMGPVTPVLITFIAV